MNESKGKRLGARRIFGSEGERSFAEILLFELIFAAVGALVGSAELLFGVRPFGVALVAAATEYFPATALGSGLFAALTRDYVSLIGIAAVGAVRVALSLLLPPTERGTHPFSERLLYRVALATLAVFGTGLYRVLSGGFRYYDLFGLLLALAATALATLLYAETFERKDHLFLYSREAGVAALILTAVFAMRSVDFFGIYPSAVAAAGIGFLLVAHRDGLWGAAGALLAGLCFEWRLAPAFFLAALGFALLQKSSRGGGILAGCAAGGAYAIFLFQAKGITLLLPSLLTAGALFLAGDSAGLVEGSVGKRARFHRRRAAELERALAMSEGELRHLGDPLVAATELENLRDAYAANEEEYESLTLAMNVLDEANAELQQRFSPIVGSLAGKLMAAMTEGSYDKVSFDREFNFTAARAGEGEHASEYLSTGTAAQLYLAVRLAICILALPEAEKCPIILDDALLGFDDKRAKAALELLKELAKERQIILFTCQSRENRTD